MLKLVLFMQMISFFSFAEICLDQPYEQIFAQFRKEQTVRFVAARSRCTFKVQVRSFAFDPPTVITFTLTSSQEYRVAGPVAWRFRPINCNQRQDKYGKWKSNNGGHVTFSDPLLDR